MVRQFLFSAAAVFHLEALTHSANPELAGISAKALKETRYHARHSGEWVIKLGDGTEESHRRAQSALDALWRYTGEMFLMDDVDRTLMGAGLGPDLGPIEAAWRTQVGEVIGRATLAVPAAGYMQRGGRHGQHTEHSRAYARRNADLAAIVSGCEVVAMGTGSACRWVRSRMTASSSRPIGRGPDATDSATDAIGRCSTASWTPKSRYSVS